MTTLTELKKLAEEATPGPWDSPQHSGYAVRNSAGYGIILADCRRTAKFIAAANPQTILKLIELVELQHGALRIEANIYIDNDPEDGPPESIAEALASYERFVKGE
jgi:hypothetical protein